jgi:hypothetical protein
MENYVKVCIYVLNGFMILIGIYLVFLFIKSKALHTFSCYNILIMCFTILLDNIIRIIPVHSLPESAHYTQAFFLVFFDKMIMVILSMQIIVVYIGIMRTESYEKNEKKIFIFGTIICVAISAILTTIFIVVHGITSDEDSELYYYCEGGETKKIIDSIFNGILLCINFFCSAVVLAHYIKLKKIAESGAIEDLGYKQKCIRFLILFFINILIIIEQYLIIYDLLFEWDLNIDLVYLISCLIIDLGYSINSIVIKETLRIICRKKPSNLNGSFALMRKNTYGNDNNEEDDDDN